MALISDAKGRREDETPSGYERLFGNTICCQLKRYKKGSYKPKCPQSLKELRVNEDTVTVWFVTKEDYKPYEIEVL